MMNKFWLFSCLMAFSVVVHADEVDSLELGEIAGIDVAKHIAMRTQTLPEHHFKAATDPFLEGYLQALVDVHYSEHDVIVTVEGHKVYVSNLPANRLFANSIVSFIKDVPGVQEVVVRPLTDKELEARKTYTEIPQMKGVWFPQSTLLFAPLVADIRQPVYQVAPRASDSVVGHKVVGVSYGDQFPFYRWNQVFKWKGDLQLGVDAGVWTVFDFTNPVKDENCFLFNTDYLVGFDLAYAVDKSSFRTRIYHISSHLGDEFLVHNPGFLAKRVNPSFEAIDFFASYQFSSGLRTYGGAGWIFHDDKSFPMDDFYVQYGTELRMFGTKCRYHKLYATPFFAMHIANWQCRNWDWDYTIKTGYEFSKLQGVGRKVALFLLYHNGYSYEGQFFKERVEYYEAGFTWGF